MGSCADLCSSLQPKATLPVGETASHWALSAGCHRLTSLSSLRPSSAPGCPVEDRAVITSGHSLRHLLGTLFASSIDAGRWRSLHLLVCLSPCRCIPTSNRSDAKGSALLGTSSPPAQVSALISSLVATGGGSVSLAFLTWCNVRRARRSAPRRRSASDRAAPWATFNGTMLMPDCRRSVWDAITYLPALARIVPAEHAGRAVWRPHGAPATVATQRVSGLLSFNAGRMLCCFTDWPGVGEAAETLKHARTAESHRAGL